ncbi:hypothetical protein HDU93_005795 [Gonapodya sp. JEL0774]|nr:hypothetical protein HDU93_005795 [Gonapodya sp. JEL0774]
MSNGDPKDADNPYFASNDDNEGELLSDENDTIEQDEDDGYPLRILGPLSCNFVCVADKSSREALIIDPGGHPEVILREVASRGFVPTLVYHTHAHFDHVGGTRMVADETGAEVGLGHEDKFLWSLLPRAFTAVGMPQPPESLPLNPSLFYRHGDTIVLPKSGKAIGRVIHTPGHTPGSCCFYFENGGEAVVCTGDTLFRRYIGRTDVLLSSLPQLKLSILRHLYTLPPSTTVIPGHGDLTTIEEERDGNLFVRHYTKEEEILKGEDIKEQQETDRVRRLKGLRALKKKKSGGSDGGSNNGLGGAGGGSAGTPFASEPDPTSDHDPAGISPSDLPLDIDDDMSETISSSAALTAAGDMIRRPLAARTRPVVEILHLSDAAAGRGLDGHFNRGCCCSVMEAVPGHRTDGIMFESVL